MTAYARIFLRYLSGYLVIRGFLPQDIADLIANDPELAGIVGAGIAFTVEYAYRMAKRYGWST